MAETRTQKVPQITGYDALELKLDPWPLPKHLIVSGDPKATGILLQRSADNKTADGVWECSPGSFRWEYTWDETAYLLEGRATITSEEGVTVHLKAGQIVHFSPGLRTEWTVTETVRKVFFLTSDRPLQL